MNCSYIFDNTCYDNINYGNIFIGSLLLTGFLVLPFLCMYNHYMDSHSHKSLVNENRIQLVPGYTHTKSEQPPAYKENTAVKIV